MSNNERKQGGGRLPPDFASGIRRPRGMEPDPLDRCRETGVAPPDGDEIQAREEAAERAPRRIDPDPVSVLLAALGALGSFASLAAYREYRRDKQRERKRARRTVLRAISASREALEDIDAALSKLERLLERNGDSADAGHLDAPVEFGSVNAFFDFFEFSAYQMLAQRVTRAFDTLIRETYEIMDAIEDGAIEAPRDLFIELRELQARLEELRRARRSFGETLAATRSVTQRMAEIADDLEKYIAFDRAG